MNGVLRPPWKNYHGEIKIIIILDQFQCLLKEVINIGMVHKTEEGRIWNTGNNIFLRSKVTNRLNIFINKLKDYLFTLLVEAQDV